MQSSIINTKTLVIFLICLFILIMGSKLSITTPLNPDIPITGQSLAVLLIGYLLQWKYGVGVIITYFIVGGLGLPVFADNAAGFDVLFGKSAGYLWGFLPAVVYISIKEYNKNNALSSVFNSFLIATIIILSFGVFWLAFSIGISNAITYGFIPYWPGAVIKLVVALLVVFVIRKGR